MSRMHEEMSLLRSTIKTSIITVPRMQIAPDSGGHVNRETQLARQFYKMPGGIDLMEGFQKTSSRAQFHRNPRHVSTSILLEWLYKLQLRFLFFWWYLPFQWSFSFGFEISFVTVSVYWMMSCVVKNPNVQRCSVHAMVFELGPYSLALMHIQSGHYVVVLQMRC